MFGSKFLLAKQSHRHFSPLVSGVHGRFFSALAQGVIASKDQHIPTVPLQYMVHMARVKINLPERGDCWFFIDPRDKVEDFVSQVKTEDPQVKSVEVLSGGALTKPIEGQKYIYTALQDRTQPKFLKVNDMIYKFDSEKTGLHRLDLTEDSPWFATCKKQGLTNIQSSTIATILKQVERNLPSVDADSASAEEGTDSAKSGKKVVKAKTNVVSVDDICDAYI